MKAIVIIGGAVLLFMLLQKKKGASASGNPMVPSVDYGAFGAYDFGGA